MARLRTCLFYFSVLLLIFWTVEASDVVEIQSDETAEDVVNYFAATTDHLLSEICACREEGKGVSASKLDELPMDCYDILQSGQTKSGRYDIYPFDSGIPDTPVRALCDMDTDKGGWTVFQRRIDGSVDFNRRWEDYKHGFGSIGGEFWLGNENLYIITSQREYEMRIEMQEWNGTKHYLTQDHFRVGDETTEYRLVVRSVDDNPGECKDYYQLGMEDGRIKDDQLTASSEYKNPPTYYGPLNARLNRPLQPGSVGAWRPLTAGNQWIQADLLLPRLVAGVILQGRNGHAQWVTKYKVGYSEDGVTWLNMQDAQGNDLVFDGNTDTDTPITSIFPSPIKARYVRIQPTVWNSHPSLRFDLLGCDGDSLAAHHNYQPFSTTDVNNNPDEQSNCADTRGAWWYGECDLSDLNAEYLRESLSVSRGIFWKDFKGFPHYLISTEMKIRPVIRATQEA